MQRIGAVVSAAAFRSSSGIKGQAVARFSPVASTVSKSCMNPFVSTQRASFATVAENTIYLQFVDSDGNRARLPGRVGQTLLQVAELHKVDLAGPCGGGGSPTEVRRSPDWVETTFGEGAACFTCHVQIPSQFHHLLPEETEENKEGLLKAWEEEVNSTSRMACQITLTKGMEGMIVYVPDMPPTDVI